MTRPLATPLNRQELLDAAIAYLPRTVPLAEHSKRPVPEDWLHWQATADSVQAWWRARPDSNVGIRCGAGLIVVDVDPQHDGDRALADLEQAHGPLAPTLTVRTGGGGQHAYYRGPRDLRTFLPAPGVEIRAAGAMIVAPPSVHPHTGQRYEWTGGRFDSRLIVPLPAWIAALAVERHEERSPTVLRAAADDPLRAIPASEYVPALTGREVDRHGYVQCPFHNGGRERTPSLRAYEDPDRGWRCYATSCGAAGDVYSLAARLRGLDRTPGGREFVRLRYELAEQLHVTADVREPRRRGMGFGR
ncbi:MAG: bifunctional DNA primase/polymerase [Solirubrobacteraceae bacterium]